MDAIRLLGPDTQIPSLSATIPLVNDATFDIDFTLIGTENDTASDGSNTGGQTTFTSASKSWTTNAWAGGKLYVLSGTNLATYDVVSNTGTVLTLATSLPNTQSSQKYLLANSKAGKFAPFIRRIFCGGAGNVKLKMAGEGASTATWRTYAVQAGQYIDGAFVKMAAAVASTGTTATGLIAEQ